MTTDEQRRARRRLLAAAALALPDRLPVVLGCVALAGLLAVLAGQFRPAVVLALALVLVAATWRWVPRAPAASAAHLGALGAVLLLAAAWVVVGVRHAAEYVVVNRDPGFLTLQALWLTDHPSAPIPVGGAAAVDAAVAAASAGTEAFWLQDGQLHAQGNTMLPTLLAMQGWVGGETAVLAGNLVIGAVALLAVFAAARRYAGPLWALVPTAALALSLPYLVFTRAAYTEPLAVAFLCGGLALAHGTWHAGGPATVGDAGRRGGGKGGGRDAGTGGGSGGGAGGRSIGRHALVGAMTGAVAAARIDGAVVVVGLALGYGLVAAAPLGRRDRRAAVHGALAAIGAGVAMTVLGMADVLLLSPEYVRVHTAQLTSLLRVTAVLVVLTVVVLLLPARALAGVRRAVHRRRRVLGWAAAGAAVAVGVLLAGRPLWWEGRFTDPDSGVAYAVQILQAAAGQPLDARRSYDEQSLAWVSWYLGVLAVALGFAGLAVLARRAVGRRDPAATLLVAVVGVAAVFPLLRVSITPDQIWAVRRLLPATFPGLLVAGACALAALAGPWAARREPVRPGRLDRPGRPGLPGWPGVRGRPGLSGGSGIAVGDAAPSSTPRRLAAGGLAFGVVAFPVTTWGTVAGVVELSGRATQAHAVCDFLDSLGVRRAVWTHSSPFRYLGTLRVLCGVEVVEFAEPPTLDDLAAVRDAWGGEPVAALTFDVSDYPWTQMPTRSVGGTLSDTLGRTLIGPPESVDTTWSEVWVGLVQEDGTVVPAG